MKGASAEVAFLSFFIRHDPFFHHAKFQFPLRPPFTFLGVFRNSWQILYSKIFLIFFLCKIWVIAAPNKHFLGVWYQKWMRNKLLLLHFFSTFLNPQRTTLTYSALLCLLTFALFLISTVSWNVCTAISKDYPIVFLHHLAISTVESPASSVMASGCT